MKCSNCQHENSGGNFCENCGNRLVAEVAANGITNAISMPQPSYQQPNPHVEKAKAVSTMYFKFFTEVIKRPIAATQNVDRSQLTNGLISIALFAFFLPLILYINLGGAKEYMDSPFLNLVIKPGLGFSFFILLLASYIFVCLKLGGLTIGWSDVIARFGSLLIPFIGIFILSFFMSLLDMELYPVLMMGSAFVSVILLPPLIIYSFKKDSPGGLDTLYATLLTYIATAFTFIVMAAVMLATIVDMIRNQLDSLFFGGFL